MTDELLADFELGEEAKRFLNTELGKYIDGCSQQDVDNAKDLLLELDSYSFTDLQSLQNAINAIQNKAKTAQDIRIYIAEAITNGQMAEHQLDQNEGEYDG